MDWLPDLSDSTLWGLVGIKVLRQSSYRVPIPPQEFTLKGAIALVEASYFDAPSTWFQAGWVTALLSSDSGRVQIARQILSLRESNLIVLPKSSGFYTLQVSFPRWIPQIRVIVKEFIGEDERPVDQLARIEQKLEIL